MLQCSGRQGKRSIFYLIHSIYFGMCHMMMQYIQLNLQTALLGHCSDVKMGHMAFQITGISTVCSTVCSGTRRRKHQSPVSLAFVKRTQRPPVDSPHKGPVTRKMFPFVDVIIILVSCGYVIRLTGSQYIYLSILLNSLWPSDSIWRHKSGSTLAQVMACCLAAPSHYMNQCWLIISKV